MTTGSAVLDSSALVALMAKEPGGEKVRPFLPRSRMSSVNLVETIDVLVRLNMNRAYVETTALQLVGSISSFDASHASAAATFLIAHRRSNLSLGDSCCLALAFMLGAEAVTMDRKWANLQLPVTITLLR